jgi:16S rRNA (uracil1498-N3)-methyltransferase
MREALASAAGVRTAALAIGPEGGWTDEEIVAARSAGFAEASLGENILRTETAVLASLAVLRFVAAGQC